MKTIAIIAAFAAASSTVAAGETVRAEGGFELRLSEEGGVRTIGVSGSDGRLAVARGADTLDKVDPKLLAKCGSLMAVLAYGLANLEQPLPR